MKKLLLSTLFKAITACVYCQKQMTLPVSFQETNVTYNLVGFERAEAVCWASCTPCSTGIETSEKSNKGILAFPNPANDRLFFNGSSSVGITSVRIFNCIGSLVASKQFQSLSNASIEIADLKNGVYFIEIENNNSTSTQKVVVQH